MTNYGTADGLLLIIGSSRKKLAPEIKSYSKKKCRNGANGFSRQKIKDLEVLIKKFCK
jgi:hypothetical protein